MNILLLDLPQTLDIGGFEVKINYDFKTSIKFNELTKGKEKLEGEDIWKALCLYYPILENTTDNSNESDKLLFTHIKENLQEAIDQIFWFYRCGEETKETSQGEEKQVKELFSYEHDSKAIISDFKREYNVNLAKESLHWWEFKSYFDGLKEDSEIRQRIRFRATDITKVPKGQEEYYRAMKKLYEIPRDIKEIEEEDEFDKAIMNGGDLSAFIRKE